MKNKLKNKKGITLIALVITIIVLLILAGVSITMISSQNGILGKATSAKETQRTATELERVKLAVQSALVDGEGTIDLKKAGINEEKVGLEKALQEEFKNNSEEPKYEEGKVTLTNGEIYNVTPSGSVEKAITFKKQGDLAIGSEVTASNGEAFYVIGFSDDNTKVNLLAKYNLKKEGIEITLKQDSTATNNECAFSNDSYWSSEPQESYPVDLNNYKLDDSEVQAKIKSTDAIEVAKRYGSRLGVKGRLMNLEEVVALGGDKTEKRTLGCPFYINTQSYWLGSASYDKGVWLVYGAGSGLSDGAFNGVYYFGVRPVIEVLKSSIK